MLVNYLEVKNVYLVCGYTDLRKGIDGLSGIVLEHQLDLFSDSVFLFCGRRTDRFKALYFDGEGFILLYKRYDRGKLNWPRKSEEVQELTQSQIQWLFEGLSIYQKKRVEKAQIAQIV